MLLRLAYPHLASLSILLRPAFQDNSIPKVCVNIYVLYLSHIFNQSKPRALYLCLFVCFWRDSAQWVRASGFDLYLSTHSTHNSQRHPCPPVGFESTISAGERPHTYALDRAATGTGSLS